MQSGSLAFRNGHRSWPTIRTVMLPYPPNTEIIARRIEAAIPPPFHLRSSSNASSQTLAKRFDRFSFHSFHLLSLLPPSSIPSNNGSRAHTLLEGWKEGSDDGSAHAYIYARVPIEIDEVVRGCTSILRETGARQAFLAVADVAADPGELISTCFGRTVDLLPSLCRLTSPLPPPPLSRPLLSLPSLHPSPFSLVFLARFLPSLVLSPRPRTIRTNLLPCSASSSRFSIETRLPFYWRK